MNVNFTLKITKSCILHKKIPDTETLKQISEVAKRASSIVKQLTEIAPYTETIKRMSVNLPQIVENLRETEREKVLREYNWLFSIIPGYIVDDLLPDLNKKNQKYIDTCITEYFNKDNATILRVMVQDWSGISCFDARRHIFEEAFNVHLSGNYNASTTLLAVHTEGLLSDFARIELHSPRFKAKNALNEIDKEMNNTTFPYFSSFSSVILFQQVINDLKKFMETDFDYKHPAIAPDNTRNKIAHGQVIEKQTEANSLRLFLYINEIYRIFYTIINGKKC